MRVSPNGRRSQSDSSKGFQFFPALVEKKDYVARQTAVFLLHCEPVQTKVLVNKVRHKGFKELILAKPGKRIFETQEIIEHLNQSSIRAPTVFILEANYGDVGSKIPNDELIQHILDNIKPCYLILYSSTEECLEAAEKKYPDRIITIWAGGCSLNSIFSRIPNLSVLDPEQKDKTVSIY